MKKSLFLLASLALATTACGGDDGDDDKEKSSRSSGGGSYASLASAIESPSGTVSEDTAGDVGRAYEESTGAAPAGAQDSARGAQDDYGVCDTGDFSVEVNDSNAASGVYDNCCILGCCIDGSFTTYVGDDSASSCVDYSLTSECEDEASVSLDFFYCIDGSTYELRYLVEVDGETFSVTGTLSGGTGSLEITGANGSFSCDYTEYSGSCTSDSGDAFDF